MRAHTEKTTMLLRRALTDDGDDDREALVALRLLRRKLKSEGHDLHDIALAVDDDRLVDARASVRSLKIEIEELSKPRRARYQFIADDRLLCWQHACYVALTTDVQMMAGSTLVIRSQALARFTSLVWRWRDVNVATIVDITRRLIADEDDDDLLDPMRADDKRPTPRARDWASLRLKLQDEARG